MASLRDQSDKSHPKRPHGRCRMRVAGCRYWSARNPSWVAMPLVTPETETATCGAGFCIWSDCLPGGRVRWVQALPIGGPLGASHAMPARHSRRWVQALPSRVLWILLRRQAACLVSPLILHALELVPVALELLPGHGGMQPAGHVPPLQLVVFVQAGVAHANWVRVSVSR